MKKIFLILISLFIANKSFAQTCAGNINIPNGPASCTVGGAAVNFYDSGGSVGSYAINETKTYTICPVVGTEKVRVVFSAFSTENSFDGLMIYSGTSSGGTLMSSGLGVGSNATTCPAGSWRGTGSPGTITSSSGDGCLTFVFRSDGSTVGSGWAATAQAIAICNMSAVTSSNAGGCNNNGTASNPADDYFTADITVTFAGKPGTGTLFLSGSGIHSGTNSVAVASTTSSTTHLFTGVKIKAIGSVQTITAAFSTDAGCTFTNSAIPVLANCGIAQGSATCATLSKLCTNVGQTLTFGATVGAADADVTNPDNNYGCLSSSPRPSWFYVQMQTGGSLDITLQGYDNTNAVVDNDFALWGPFANLAAAQAACNTYGANIDCSYDSGSGAEAVNIPVTATAGQVFVLLVTAYSGSSSHFTLLQTGGTGSTECSGVVGACDISAVTAVPTACTAGLYNLTGSATFVNPPATGNLLIKVDGVLKQTIAVAASPMSYSVTGLTADGASHTVSAEFSAASTCNQTQTYTSPAACSGCSAGVMTLGITTP